MNITPKQRKWLIKHGDRNINDVEIDVRGLYVLMWNGGRKTNGEYVKIYLPKDKTNAI